MGTEPVWLSTNDMRMSKWWNFYSLVNYALSVKLPEAQSFHLQLKREKATKILSLSYYRLKLSHSLCWKAADYSECVCQ